MKFVLLLAALAAAVEAASPRGIYPRGQPNRDAENVSFRASFAETVGELLYSRADVESIPYKVTPYSAMAEEDYPLVGFRGAVESRPPLDTSNIIGEPSVRAAIADTRENEACSVEGTYKGHPGDCGVYFMCHHGKYKRFTCTDGLVWNKESSTCDWPATTNCAAKATEGATTTGKFGGTPSVTAPAPAPAPVVELEQSPQGSGSLGNKMVVCYFTNWAWYRRGQGKYMPSDIDPNLCTHIVYGFAVLDSTTLTIKPHDTWADFDNKFYQKVTDFKKQGKKVTIAIGGWNDSLGSKYSRLVGNAAARAKFIDHVLEFIKTHNFDGLDLDWEYPVCWQVDCSKGPKSDKENFSLLVQELSARLKPLNLLLSAAVSPSKKVIDLGYDVPTLNTYLDWIAVMTYDYHGHWDKKTGHVAPMRPHPDDDYSYFNMEFTIDYWIEKGAAANKLVLGMPLYGQAFTLTDASVNGLNAPGTKGTAGEFTKAAGFLAYYEICDRLRKGWTVVKDDQKRMGPYAYKGNQWVGFDDTETIRLKSQYVLSKGLAGAMVWALDLDDFKGTCGQGKYPLMNTIRSVLGGGSISVQRNDLEAFSPDVRGDLVDQVCQDAQFKHHESDCGKFYQCNMGTFIERKCGPGTHWGGQACVLPEKSGCKSSPSGITTTKTKPQQPAQPATKAPPTAAVATTIRAPWSQPPTTTYKYVPWTPSTTTRKPTTTGRPMPGPSAYKVVCYFTNWAWYRRGMGKYVPEDIDGSLCTHIVYGFAVLKNGRLSMHDRWADVDNHFYDRVVAYKSQGIKVLIALGGWNDSGGTKYAEMLKSGAQRKAFNNHALEFVKKHNFDGLDLDYEYPACPQTKCSKDPAVAESQKRDFTLWMKELSALLKPAGLLLTAAVTPNPEVIDAGYDVPAANTYLDWIAVMAYDYHGSWDKATGHNAPMYHHPESPKPTFNANHSINYWIGAGASPSKIVMGMPTYGRSFTIDYDQKETGLWVPAKGGTAGKFTKAKGFLAFYEICENILTNGYTKVNDPTGTIGPYAYKGKEWVGYDDIPMIRHKSEFVKSLGLGGAMIWALDLDDFRDHCGCGKYPLLTTINIALGRIAEPLPTCAA